MHKVEIIIEIKISEVRSVGSAAVYVMYGESDPDTNKKYTSDLK